MASPPRQLSYSSCLRTAWSVFWFLFCHHLVTSHFHLLAHGGYYFLVLMASLESAFVACTPGICCLYSLYTLHSILPRGDLLALFNHCYFFPASHATTGLSHWQAPARFAASELVLTLVHACQCRAVCLWAAVCCKPPARPQELVVKYLQFCEPCC